MAGLEARVAKGAERARALQAEAQADLALAMPALESAVEALEALSKADITEIKSFAKPPHGVIAVCTYVLALVKPGAPSTWKECKQLLGDPRLLELLLHFDKDRIEPSTMQKVRSLQKEHRVSADAVGQISKAAAGLCCWVDGMLRYHDVAERLAPKRDELRALQLDLTAAQSALADAQRIASELQAREDVPAPAA